MEGISDALGMNSPGEFVSPTAPTGMHEARVERVRAAMTFAAMSLRYAVLVFPSIAVELRHWRARAQRIPDATLRRLALEALSKRGNMEGAGLFAVFAPRAHRRAAVRALVAFQAAYNYLDVLAEQPSADPVGNGRRLHEALLAALEPDSAHADYYALNPRHEDGGFLLELLERCRASLAVLPSYALVAPTAKAAAARIVEFQSLNLGVRQGASEGLERWSRELAAVEGELEWWEAAGAAGSSLAVHALIGLAAETRVEPSQALAIEDAYFPWIGALHSLLDSLVDVGEDRREQQRNLLGYYASIDDAAKRLRVLAQRGRTQAQELLGGRRHAIVHSAMVAYYLASRAASGDGLAGLAQTIAQATGPPTPSALLLFRAARRISDLLRGER